MHSRKFLKNLMFSDNFVYEIKKYVTENNIVITEDSLKKLILINDLFDELRSDIVESIPKNNSFK